MLFDNTVHEVHGVDAGMHGVDRLHASVFFQKKYAEQNTP
jgi:hypothetical protein